METALLLAAVALATVACPALAWIQRRRGRSACCVTARTDDRAVETADLPGLRAKRAQVEERIAALETEPTRHG